MEQTSFAIIEIGSNNTKVHVYDGDEVVYESNVTITLKEHYIKLGKVDHNDLGKLDDVIKDVQKYASNIYLYGCSIFRQLSQAELDEINSNLRRKFDTEIEVVSQDDEAKLTALGCYDGVNYDGKMCIFIGGGGSIELILVEHGKIIDSKYYGFGVVDVTKKFPSLSSDIPEVGFMEVWQYVDNLLGDLNMQAEVLVLAGGDHPYWYKNAQYELRTNTLYDHHKQPFMLTKEMSDQYDRDAYETSLDKIRQRSDDPLWFDYTRAMKTITNCVMHKIGAEFVVPTKINMEDGLKGRLAK